VTEPPELVGENGRRFAGFAAAVLVFVIDGAPASGGPPRVLLLSSPHRTRGWEIVNGGLEAGETLLAGAAREVAEEAGPDLLARVLGVVHASTWRYDAAVTHMISTFFVASYEGGAVVPGDDMAGSTVQWATLDEVRSLAASGAALVPGEVWLFERAFESFDRWVSSPVTLADLHAGFVEE
jgi:8-oxo-dGTP pyrophosphatase MutT (NUDIX family)